MADIERFGYIYELEFDGVRASRVMGSNIISFESTHDDIKEMNGYNKNFGCYDIEKRKLEMHKAVITEEQEKAIKLFCEFIRKLTDRERKEIEEGIRCRKYT
ncbi:MAG: hypothetical protein LUD47_07805 [Clostridia bacterium]|nr:hypothetical protein [Clostridia bacterium]